MRSYGAALSHSLAFAIALFVNRMDDWPALAWIFFFFLGCGFLVFDGSRYRFGSFLRSANLAWLMVIGVVVFLYNRTYGVTPEIWTLAAMPMLALCMKKQYLKYYIWGFGAVIITFSIGLITQWAFHIAPTNGAYRYTWVFNPAWPAAAWPMIDPNNAALVLNCALLPIFYSSLKVSKWIPVGLLLIAALFFTGSKAGIGAAVIGCLYLAVQTVGFRWWLGFVCAACAACAALAWLPLGFAFASRLPLWGAAASLLDINPLTGVGVGVFQNYYQHIRTEHYSSGFFAHNDMLQIAVEMGIPAAFVFGLQWVVASLETCPANRVSAAVLFAILAQSMVEFQFYVPAISLLAGLAFAWHTYHNEEATWEESGLHLSGQ